MKFLRIKFLNVDPIYGLNSVLLCPLGVLGDDIRIYSVGYNPSRLTLVYDEQICVQFFFPENKLQKIVEPNLFVTKFNGKECRHLKFQVKSRHFKIEGSTKFPIFENAVIVSENKNEENV